MVVDLAQLVKLDWRELQSHNPRLQKFWADGKFDFDNETALAELVQTQLDLYCGLRVQLCKGFLIPRLANRLDYLLWMEKLLGGPAVGIDVGVGGNCIYPMLGSLVGLTIAGVDLNSEAIEASQQIAKQASIEIDLFQADGTDLESIVRQLDPPPCFVVCNPPFFAPQEDRVEKPPRNLVARENELYTPGGELEFSLKMLESSSRTNLRWTSVMLGKKHSVAPLIDRITAQKASHALHVISHGRTRRWIVAWSFSERAPDEVSRSSMVKRSLNPPRTKRAIDCDYDFVMDQLKNMEHITIELNEAGAVLSAPGIVWSRAYKRRGSPIGGSVEISIRRTPLVLQLVRGDFAVFESFITFLERRVRLTH